MRITEYIAHNTERKVENAENRTQIHRTTFIPAQEIRVDYKTVQIVHWGVRESFGVHVTDRTVPHIFFKKLRV